MYLNSTIEHNLREGAMFSIFVFENELITFDNINIIKTYAV